MDAERATITEGELAHRLGVGRDVLMEIRGLLEADTDWGRRKNAVIYFQPGVTKACELLSVPAIVLPAPLAPAVNPWTTAAGIAPEPLPAAAVDQGEVRTVYVRRRARANTHMIFVTEKKAAGEAEEFAVRVRAAKHFVPGQEIRISASTQGGLPILHGKQPRHRGRVPGQRLRSA